MKTIYKYPIPLDDEFELELPHGAQVLSAGLDPFGRPCMWALVDSDAVRVSRKFKLLGTGLPAVDVKAHEFVATIKYEMLMLHLFQPEYVG